MKISHKSKRFIAPHPQVAALIADLLATSTEDLPKFLGAITYWRWPRSDLNVWIRVLNKLDTVLEEVIREYDVDGLQVKPFSHHTKETVLEILKFERLLLENSTNRKMFNSYDRLNSLLFTSDLDVLVATLMLLLRPSQQYSSQPAVSHSLHISTQRLESLAKAPPSFREHGIEMLDLVSDRGEKRVEDLPHESSEVNFTFYRKGEEHVEKDKEKEKEKKDAADSNVFGSARPTHHHSHSSAPSSAPHVVHLGPLAHTSRSPMEILADAVKSHQVPEGEKFELLCRIRNSWALGPGRLADRRKLVVARLLSIAVYAHTHPENQAQASLFVFDTDLVNRIADLLQLDRGVPEVVQTAALAALDGLARYRSKIHEVLAAVNAGVNHGLLMSLFRKTVTDISRADSDLSNYFVDALLSFVIFIASQSTGGTMVVGAGLVPLLIQIIGINHPKRLPVVSKTMQLVDNVLYGFMNAFTIFCNSRGVEVLTERIRHEVDVAIRDHGSEEKAHCPSSSHGLLQFHRAGVLKHILRSMHRMMQSSGTTEGMRGLIDSSLLKSVEKIIKYRGVFGPTVLPIAINIVATFVHNEPTSLTAIQEAKLPETIYSALEAGIEPSFEVIQAIPNVIGALCLNQTGQDQLASHPSIIPALFSILTSERHLKVLLDKENAVSIGSAMDELVRHHPSLRTVVFSALVSTLKKIEDLGNAYVPPADIRQWYTLSMQTPQAAQPDSDVAMEDVQSTAVPAEAVTTAATPTEVEDAAQEEATPKNHDNLIVNFIDALGRFLEGLFQHPPHCKEFTETEGMACFARLLALPCLPYDYANSVYSDSIVQVVRTMAEIAPTETLGHLSKQVKESLDETEDFWKVPETQSRFLPHVEITDERSLNKANDFFRRMVTLHIRLTLLSDVYATAGYTHGRNAVALLQNVPGVSTLDIIPSLGALHRTCIWENIALKSGLASKGVTLSTNSSESLTADGPSASLDNLNGSESKAAQTTASSGESHAKEESQKTPETPTNLNALALKHIASQIPNSLSPFFQAVAKMLMYGRRNPDESQKMQAAAVSAVLAEVMYKHLTEYKDGDPSTLYAYHTIMLGLITVLLFDDRTSQNSHHAVLLLHFRKLGGLDAVLETTRRFTESITRISAIRPADRSDADKQEMVHVFGGLKMALHLLYSLISYKPSVDAGQIALFIARDKPETHPDYYEPHDFLVKMRLSIAPLIKDIWNSSWLTTAPPAVNKYVIQSVQEIIAGENEVPKNSDYMAEATSALAANIGLLRPSNPTPSVPDEDRIRQLTDMGFPRASAVRALQRSHNNVSLATEYLLTHPFEPIPDEPAPQAELPPPAAAAEIEGEPAEENQEMAEATNAGDATNDANGDGNVAMDADPAPAPAEPSAETSAPQEDFVPEKTAEERRQELDELRKTFTTNIGPLMLRLVDAHPSLIFDIKQAFVGASDTYHADAVRSIISDIERFSPMAFDVQEEPLSVRCRLLALILSEASRDVLETEKDGSLMNLLHSLLLSQPIGNEPDQPLPKWLAALLLAMEILLARAEEPRPVALVMPDDPVNLPELLTGPPYNEARTTLFDLSIRLLRIPTLPRDELLSTLRVLILLTKERAFADKLITQGGIPLLLQRLQAPSTEAAATGLQSHVAIIFRHLVEDRTILENVIEQEIKRIVTGSRGRTIDVLSYVRSSQALVARSPRIFFDVTQKDFALVRPDGPHHHIAVRPGIFESGQSQGTKGPGPEESEKTESMQVDESVQIVSDQSIAFEAVVHHLLEELLRVGKSASDKLRSEAATATATAKADSHSSNVAAPANSTTEVPVPPDTSSAANATEESGPAQQKDDYFYACFLMQCLSELLFSYDQCKIAFLSYPKSRTQTPSKNIISRSKSTALNFLLSELVSFGAFNVEPKFDARKRIILCNWAMSVIVALCVDAGSLSEGSMELSSIRKLVLESISRSLKESPPNETTDARYGRILALADLCHRLLTVRFSGGSSKSLDETPMQLAKIMLEKNFVATLTHVLTDVDLNYPNMRSLVAAILRPLDFLTKIAIKMGRTSDKNKDALGKIDTPGSLSSDSEDEEDIEVDDDREETPDLYRNSSLGMFAGEMEDSNYEDDAMEDGEDEEDEDIDVEYDEETGSDDSSNTDEDVEGEMINADTGGPDEWGVEVDEEMDDDGDMDDEDTEDEMEDEDDAEGEIMWEDAEGADVDGGEEIGDDGEDEDEMVEAMADGDDRAAEEDGADVLSAAEDLADELGELEETGGTTQDGDDPFSLIQPAIRSFTTRSRLFFGGPQGRDMDGDMQIFGRPRYPGISAEAMAHPLLVDTSSTNATPGLTRTQYRRTRTGGPPNPFTDMLQTIEGLVGGDAMQLVEELMQRTGGAIGDIRVEVPGTSALLGNLERGQIHRHGRGLTASVRLRDPRTGESRSEVPEFGPQPTSQRWLEEAKITHGKHLQERMQKLCNHIILTLLPEAREKAREEKEKEEKERAEREKEEKEREEKEKAEKERAEKETAESPALAEIEAGSSIVQAQPEGTGPSVPNPVISTSEVPEVQIPSASALEPRVPEVSMDVDAEMVDASEAVATEGQPSMEVSEHADEAQVAIPAPAGGEPSTSATRARVTITIHGNEVDITDTGIDPTFLEALPDDMREEVLNQHVREQRAARADQVADTQISAEFLEALPPDIRMEILQQERMERARHEQQEGAQANGGPADINAADFIASLDPQLRHVVLLDSDDAILQSLPPHMIAEAGIIREGAHLHHMRREAPQPRAPATPSQKKATQTRDAIQLLDRTGIAALVRLLFFPQLSKKTTLHKVLLNLCENSKSRTDVFNLLLGILQDGSGDVALVDKTFAQLSVRNTKGTPQSSAKSAGKQKEVTPSAHSSIVPPEIPADVVAQRCLDALSFIVETNELSSLFFLTEHELPAGLKKNASKKGKGKEKQTPQSHYPIVLLLGLLERQALVKTPAILDSIAALLDAVTRPLTTIKDEAKKKDENASQPSGSETVPTTEGSVAMTTIGAPDVNQPSAGPSQDASQGPTTSVQAVEEKILLSNPSQIPHPALRSIVNILTVGECSSRTFQHTLALIQHLSYLPDAREVIAQELKLRAQEFGQNLLVDLDALISALQQSTSEEDLPPAVASKFSPASSDQAKLLRVLKTIDYMYSKPASGSSTPNKDTPAEQDNVRAIYESFRFAPLWQKLSECLSVVESKTSNVEHVATILLPLIETLMVVCKNVGMKNGTQPPPPSSAMSPSSPRSPLPDEESSVDELFVSFTNEHRKILNLMVRNNPSLMSGSFSLLVQNPRVLDFDNKRNYFNQQLHKRPYPREHYPTLQINVRRARVFEDSYHTLQGRTGDQIKYGKLSVRFYNEEGVDAGGVTREWFQILARQMFDPNYALFEPCAADRQTYQPNQASAINPVHLLYFKFVGRIIGKAIYDGRLMDAHFARSLYRQLLGKPVDYRDVEWIDPEYYKSLCWILENDPSILDLTFITEVEEFGQHKIIPLKDNGASIPVTLDNRKEYVRLSAEYRLYSSIKDQIESLRSGFYEVIPKDLISIFNEQELELLISGTPDIDVDEWRAATEYNGYTSSDPVIVWWWRALKSFNRDERAKVLSFATGTSRVPLGGFVELQGVQGVQRFSIHKAYGDPDRLPQAHTCFNQIDLPQYSSYEKLRQQLLLAINEGGEGFGFA